MSLSSRGRPVFPDRRLGRSGRGRGLPGLEPPRLESLHFPLSPSLFSCKETWSFVSRRFLHSGLGSREHFLCSSARHALAGWVAFRPRVGAGRSQALCPDPDFFPGRRALKRVVTKLEGDGDPGRTGTVVREGPGPHGPGARGLRPWSSAAGGTGKRWQPRSLQVLPGREVTGGCERPGSAWCPLGGSLCADRAV